MLIMLALVPLILAVVIIAIASSRVIVSNLKQSTREELMMAAKGLREYYEYDFTNQYDLVDGFIKYDTSYIDSINRTGVDLTLFKGNIRFMTTIKGSDGKRIEGTPASASVWEAVRAGNDYYSDNVQINGTDRLLHAYYKLRQGIGYGVLRQTCYSDSRGCYEYLQAHNRNQCLADLILRVHSMDGIKEDR